MVTEKGRQGTASRDTSREHRAIVRAVQLLERALASPNYGRVEAWKRRARSDLKGAVRELENHRTSAEKPGGILDQLEIILGRPIELRRVMDGHAILIDRAQELSESLDDPDSSGEEIRALAASLTELIRSHQAQEADLILEAFNRDIGVGD